MIFFLREMSWQSGEMTQHCLDPPRIDWGDLPIPDYLVSLEGTLYSARTQSFFAWPCTLEILLLPECAAEPMVTTEPCFKSTYARLPSRFTFSVFRQKADGWLTASLLVIVVMLYGTMYTCPCPVEPVPGGPFLRMVPL